MSLKKLTWQEKLEDSKDLPKIGDICGKMTKRWGEGTMLIPAPKQVDAIMRKVPRGQLITIEEIRQRLARQHRVNFTCPITTGIFAWIAAHAAAEAEASGKVRVTPYWRTLKTGGELNPKYPGGVANLARRLKAEGHTITKKGKRTLVLNYSDRLVSSGASRA